MKKIILLAVSLLIIHLLHAQGVYQMWGTTPNGGKDGMGLIYSTNSAGDNFHVRYNFKESSSSGAHPVFNNLVKYNGKFYGMTSDGGNKGLGVIFEWDALSNQYTKKIDFDGTMGAGPRGSLTLVGTKFYGMTHSGGSNNRGVIFEWDPVTNIYTRKINLNQSTGNYPYGSLTYFDNKFYGMTASGGSYGRGVIFEWTPVSNIFVKKIDFEGTNGENPQSDLIVNDGHLYGVTFQGGTTGQGTIFEWNPSSNILTKKIDFDGSFGVRPNGNLTFFSGKFYGTTTAGGIFEDPANGPAPIDGNGEIFEWDPVSNTCASKVKLTLAGGCEPYGNLTLKSGILYGMTASGGTYRKGVIFEFNPLTNNYLKKIDFDGINGSGPAGSLVLEDDNFYGLTGLGGSNSLGVIFEWKPAANLITQSYSFGLANEGQQPHSSLFPWQGKLYGLTNNGGTNNESGGTIFEYDAASDKLTKKIDLTPENGMWPSSNNLTLYKDKFYGLTSKGGIDGGVIFKWDPITNIYIKKFEFNGNNGFSPRGDLTIFEGTFYGTTAAGGNTQQGVIFSWNPELNNYLKKFDFNKINGVAPIGKLILINKKFYGITGNGGTNDVGVIFEWDPISNEYNKKIDFSSSLGKHPSGSLIAIDGKLYGVTNSGGAGNGGLIFEWDPVTNIYIKKLEFANTGLNNPAGSLTLVNNRIFGHYAYGIFEWDRTSNKLFVKKFMSAEENLNPEGGSDLTVAPAPVANVLSGVCTNLPSVTIDSSNNNQWVSITDTLGNAVAEIKANGNNLGTVNSSLFINDGPVREDGSKTSYLNRSISLVPQMQPKTPVNVRLYITNSEFLALKNNINSGGKPSGIDSINNLVIYQIIGGCSSIISSLTNPLVTVAGTWDQDYVLSASTLSLSSYYFAGKKSDSCVGPVITCNTDIVTNATSGKCGAIVNYKAPIATDLCGNATVSQVGGLRSGAFFPVGTTVNTFVATGSTGKKDTCSFKVTVKDKEPPHITVVCAKPVILWPPDHKMTSVTIDYTVKDNCGAVKNTISVSSNESVYGTGCNDQSPDWVLQDDHHVLLRAERSGHGKGRVYTIMVTSKDGSGNTATERTKVLVPYDARWLFGNGWHHNGYIDANGEYCVHHFDVKVIPNPSHNYFTVQVNSSSSEKIEAKLLDHCGRLISKLTTVKNQVMRFGDNLRPGIYMVEITQGRQRKTIKIIKL